MKVNSGQKTSVYWAAGIALLMSLLLGCSKQSAEQLASNAVPEESSASHESVAPDRVQDDMQITYTPPQWSWELPPGQAPVTEGFLDVGGAKIWYWDTGGEGEAVVFSHPASSSGLGWDYQQPFLVEEGYRVIGYSRRGHYQSDLGDYHEGGSATNDLLQLVDHLGVDRFHIVAMAAGAHIAPDFASSYPERVLSMAVGVTIGRTGDSAFTATNPTLMPPGFGDLPVWIKELSFFYRGANPEGTQAWIEKSALARVEERIPVTYINEFSPEFLAAIGHSKLLFTGDSDFYMPPSRLRSYAAYFTDPEVVIFQGAGHAPHWEQPLAFNQTLLNFLRRNGAH